MRLGVNLMALGPGTYNHHILLPLLMRKAVGAVLGVDGSKDAMLGPVIDKLSENVDPQ